MTAKKSTKTGKNFRGGGGEFFWLARVYTLDFLSGSLSGRSTKWETTPISTPRCKMPRLKLRLTLLFGLDPYIRSIYIYCTPRVKTRSLKIEICFCSIAFLSYQKKPQRFFIHPVLISYLYLSTLFSSDIR